MRLKRIALVSVALQTLRANPFNTLLSTLGLIIGVAALVGILSFGDGLEAYAREQIAQTTDLQTLVVTTRTTRRIDGVSVRIDDPPALGMDELKSLEAAFPEATFVLTQRQAAEVTIPNDTTRSAAYVEYTTTREASAVPPMAAGRVFDAEDLRDDRKVIVLSMPLAQRLAPSPDSLLDTIVRVGGQPFTIIGILAPYARNDDTPRAFAPFTAAPPPSDRSTTPTLSVQAPDIERVEPLKEAIQSWTDERFASGREGFVFRTNAARVAQAERGVLVFKLVMGFITGLSVLVGGIGIMNVLLMSVTERTREIGVRKATGARRSDVVFQFLTEAVAIASLGGLLGIALGVVTVLLGAEVIRHVADVPFEPAFTVPTLGLVMLIAALVGVGFGTYPAWRAARLEPVEAIRYE